MLAIVGLYGPEGLVVSFWGGLPRSIKTRTEVPNQKKHFQNVQITASLLVTSASLLVTSALLVVTSQPFQHR